MPFWKGNVNLTYSTEQCKYAYGVKAATRELDVKAGSILFTNGSRA